PEPAGEGPGRDRLPELDRMRPVQPQEPRAEPEPDRTLELALPLGLVGLALEPARVEPIAARTSRRLPDRRGRAPPDEARRDRGEPPVELAAGGAGEREPQIDATAVDGVDGAKAGEGGRIRSRGTRELPHLRRGERRRPGRRDGECGERRARRDEDEPAAHP